MCDVALHERAHSTSIIFGFLWHSPDLAQCVQLGVLSLTRRMSATSTGSQPDATRSCARSPFAKGAG